MTHYARGVFTKPPPVVRAGREKRPDGEVFTLICPYCGKWHEHLPEESVRYAPCFMGKYFVRDASRDDAR
jgi:hypothetical protein